MYSGLQMLAWTLLSQDYQILLKSIHHLSILQNMATDMLLNNNLELELFFYKKTDVYPFKESKKNQNITK